MTVGEDGFSVCGRLEDHPQFNKWKDEMAPGELWSLFGEKWLAEGVAAQVSKRFFVVHEAQADFATATELADRVLTAEIDWLDESLLDS